MSGQHSHPGQLQPTQTLASDADRDRTAGLLNAAFAEGRLTADEHAERLRDTYAARSWQQLDELTTDLPTGQDAIGQHVAAPAGAGLDWCMLCLLIACPPAGIAWLLAAWRRSRAGAGAAPGFSDDPPAARGGLCAQDR